METIVLAIHLMVAAALIAVVLFQRSEGGLGGLGGGGGGGAAFGGVMSGRGAANLMTRATAILAAIFMTTSLVLGIIARTDEGPSSIIDDPVPAQEAPTEPQAPAAPAAPTR